MRFDSQIRIQLLKLLIGLVVATIMGCMIVAIVNSYITAPVPEGQSRLGSYLSTNGSTLFQLTLIISSFLFLAQRLFLPVFNKMVGKTRVGRSEVIISKDKARVGEAFEVTFRQSFRNAVKVQKILIQLVLRETAYYKQGKTVNWVVHDHTHFKQSYPGRRYKSGEQFEASLEIQIPEDGMHTIEPSLSRKNVLQWFVCVEVDFASGPSYKEEFEIRVLPEMVPEWTS